MTPSPEQEAICSHVRTSSSNLVVEAAPGSGKTTTIGMAARGLPLGKLYVALAFAKANAEDFQRKLPHFVQASTCHSLCLGAIRGGRPRVKVKADKVKYLIKDDFGNIPWEDTQAHVRLVSLLKQQVGVLTEDDVIDMADAYGINLPESSGVSATLDILAASDSQRDVLDFDDMLRFALDASVRFPAYGLVFIDEAQDTNAVQRALLTKFACRIVAVGDPYQSIYGFRGADSNAMTRIREDFRADVLPLSVSYRCSQNVVAEAQRVLADSRFNQGASAGGNGAFTGSDVRRDPREMLSSKLDEEELPCYDALEIDDIH